jgi:hypothetical protein
VLRRLPLFLLAALLLLGCLAWAQAIGSSYPDLRALPPAHLFLDTADVNGAVRHVLRFGAAIENTGPAALELRGDSSSRLTQVYQRIPGNLGQVDELSVGAFVFHRAHNHWHFEHFADYELWTRAAYEAWLASGRLAGQPGWRGSKTTGQGESFCVRDSMQVHPGADSPTDPVYQDCGEGLQGISVGWADVYDFFLPEQWVEIGDAPLPDGEYVLRVVADPQNLIYESPDRADPQRESPEANEGVTFFTVRNGCAEEAPTEDGPSESPCADTETDD